MTLAFLLVLAAPSIAASPESDMIRGLLPRVRAAEADLSIRADRWDAPMALEPVEDSLRSPLGVPERALDPAGAPATLSEAVRDAARRAGFGVGPSSAASRPSFDPPAALADPALREALGGLLVSLVSASGAVERAAAASSSTWARSVDVLGGLAMSDPADEGVEAAFAAARGFEPAPWGEALLACSEAVEKALPGLRDAAARGAFRGRLRFKTPMGDVLLSGAQDDRYTEHDLEGAALVVDLGGKSRYEAPPAAAGPGRLRVVVDLSPELAVEASSGAGAGTFGVGLFAAPTPGTKTFRAGDLSLGAGLLGAGAAWLAGPVQAETGRLSQGAAAFGLGVFLVEGDSSTLTTDLGSQGYGFTRGSGLFVLRGSGSRLDCGLKRPDGHENLAFLSLCQGVGYGPRAFAAGGVGTALVVGSSNALRAGYMAQGMGYWHGLGALAVRGNANRLLGRRYVQGAGVHTAAGLLAVEGDANEARVWGVGPGYGWDYGVGWAVVRGSSNTLASEWASARGDINGHGFVAVRGDGNRLALGDAAAGSMRRNAPSYGFAAASGTGNVLRDPLPDPWGASAGFTPRSDLAAGPAEWPVPERGPAEEADARRVLRAVAASEAQAAPERLRAWLGVLADSGLEQHVPLSLAERILLDGAEAPALLPGLASPERFDEGVWVRLLSSAGGKNGARAAARALAAAAGPRRAVLASLLSVFDSGAAETALGLAADPDWRVRRAALLSVGQLLSREAGEEPGRLSVLAEAEAAFAKGADAAALARVGGQRFAALLQALSVDAGTPREGFVRLLRAAGGSVLDRLPPAHAAVKELFAVLAERPSDRVESFKRERLACEALTPRAAEVLKAALDDPEPEVAQAALTSLALLGRAEDAPHLAARLNASSALMREAAAAGLGRMGPAGAAEISKALSDPDPARRVLGVLAGAQSSAPAVLDSLLPALRDPEASVRAAAVAGLAVVQEPLKPRRAAFLPELRRLAAEDPDPALRAAAARMAAAL